MVDELIVKSITANRRTINQGEFVRIIIVFNTQENLVEPYVGDLVVEVNGETVHTEEVVAAGDPREVEVPIRLSTLDENEVCAFITNVSVVGPGL